MQIDNGAMPDRGSPEEIQGTGKNIFKTVVDLSA